MSKLHVAIASYQFWKNEKIKFNNFIIMIIDAVK